RVGPDHGSKIGRTNARKEFGHATFRQPDEKFAVHRQLRSDGPKQQIEGQAHDDDGERAWNDLLLLEKIELSPEDQEQEPDPGDGHRTRVQMTERVGDFGKRVAAIGLQEVHISLVILGEANSVRDLLEDQDDADGGQHALDDAIRDIVGKNPCPYEAQHDLDSSRDHYGSEKSLVAPERLNRREYNDSETRGGSADSQGGP